ncbi:hypothetical protein NAL32_11805 [Chryseobacterium sp. Ch-15]|uniref:Uncharacterized protein n=1 Tax=Chryseobacterium muglaense TaxID=2893752 RepID=A0A9Q3YRD9_9FLAO|nr:hypothetical protein [Chryseobacterium muglaense]MBD3905221.1 hypothetical protein [Chryseobacterium muglaense]MCC9034073.1 hypothetical protein [Chryseobacterium muglaense]MCM2555066.1 hypothetical protein [Chryseobacterium muglaense]
MTENFQIKSLHKFITENRDVDSDYWYFSGNIDIIKIFKNFTHNDLKDLEKEYVKWDIEYVEILIDCFIYGYFDEITFSKQSYFLTFLLANLKNEDERLNILENASDVILKGNSKPTELLNSIIDWIEINKYNEIPYYHSQCLKIYETREKSIETSRMKLKINELKNEIFSLTKLMRAFDEIDGIQDTATNILKTFNNVDFQYLKLDLLLWSNDELEILAKVFSRGDVNGNLIDDNYFFGYLFVLLPISISTILLEDMFYFFENQKIDCGLLQQMKNKLNELIAKKYIESDIYEYWTKKIIEKQKTCC